MLTLHHLDTSRSQRILWLLEELGVPYAIQRYARDPRTKLAPPELKKIHPLGKSPVITTEDGEAIAESGAILEYLAERYAAEATGDLAHLVPAPGTPEHRQCRFFLHYAEGSLMNWLVMKLVLQTVPRQPMPFFVRPVAQSICSGVQSQLVDPNLATATAFLEQHLTTHRWFAGEKLTLADFQMSFAVEALLSRSSADAAQTPRLHALLERIHARPAWQRALAQGGPVLMG